MHPTLLVLDEGAGFAAPPTTTLGDLGAESGRGLALVRELGVETVLGNRPGGGPSSASSYRFDEPSIRKPQRHSRRALSCPADSAKRHVWR